MYDLAMPCIVLKDNKISEEGNSLFIRAAKSIWRFLLTLRITGTYILFIQRVMVMGLAAKNTSHQEIIPADNSESVEVIVHISDDLGKQQRNDLLSRMSDESGILEANIAELRGHFMIVRYDRNSMSSRDVIDAFKESNLDARLIISI
jgi:hypothetical protein